VADNTQSVANQQPRWAITTAVLIQLFGLGSCLGAFALNSRSLALCAAFYLVMAWLIRWISHATALRNLHEMPLLGNNALSLDIPETLPSVTIIAPARNEERFVEQAVQSMEAMDYPVDKIVVINDHSTDATPVLLDALAKSIDRLSVFHNPLLQDGWLGKQNAIWTALQQTAPKTDWILFTDGDIRFGSTVLHDAILFAEEKQLDFLTCIPWIETASILEELALVPRWANQLECFEYAKLNEPKGLPLGIGAFMLARRKVYEEAGGHAAIKNDHADDMALARLMKQHGARMGFARAGDQLRCRQYNGFPDAMRNLVRKQRVACHDRYGALISTGLHAIIQSLAPLPIALAAIVFQTAGQGFSLAFTALAIASALLYIQGVRKYAIAKYIAPIHFVSAILHPISGAIRCWLTIAALTRKASGKSVGWRGRNTA
jgi:hypothetical protein